MAEEAVQQPRRKRAPPRMTTVKTIERLTPKLIRMTVTGDDLEGFGPARPGGHIKLLFPTPGSGWNHKDPDAARPPSRTYTPRRYDPASKTLQVEFVLHGAGLASSWAERAKEGETLYVAGPGGGYDVPQDTRTMVLVADETSMPAAGMILEATPQGAAVTALCEVPDGAEERPLSPTVTCSPKWLHRGAAAGGTLLEAEVKKLDAPADAHWWIACEAGAMRRIRMHLVKDRKVDPTHIHTRGYWRLGETNYPDHDYGND
jgi:NADPH-dependent ferric siderophore reductase